MFRGLLGDSEAEIEVGHRSHRVGELGEALHHVGAESRVDGDGRATLHGTVVAAQEPRPHGLHGVRPPIGDFIGPEALSAVAGIPPTEVLGVPLLVIHDHLLRRSEPGQDRHHAGNRIPFPLLDVLQSFVADLHELRRAGDVEVLRPPNGDGLQVLVSHDGADAESAGAGAALLDGSEVDPVFAGQADGGHRGRRLVQLLANELCSLESAQTPEMRGVTYFHLVIVDPQIDEIRGLAADDHLVITGVLQFWTPESAHHRECEQPSLRRDGGDDGAIASGSGCAGEEAGAEDEEIIGREGLDFGGYSVPDHLGIRAQTPEIELGESWVGCHPLDVASGQVDFQVEPRLRVPHSSTSPSPFPCFVAVRTADACPSREARSPSGRTPRR